MAPMMNVIAIFITVILAAGIPASKGCILVQPIGDGNPKFLIEVSTTQIAYVGEARSLNCAAVNFCNVTWYKNGIPLPGAPHEEVQKADDRTKGQFLQFKSPDLSDAALYTCVVSNGEDNINRTMRLVVLEDTRADKPIFLGSNGGSCADRTAEIGDTVHFSCEFFVGKDFLSQSFVSWYRVDANGDETPADWLEDIETKTEQNIRMEKNIVVSDLEIPNIKKNAFGSWRALIYSNGYLTKAALVSVGQTLPSTTGATVKSLLETIKTGFKKRE